MPKGKVKWFNNLKGYGFIAREAGPDVFVHYSSISAEGYRSLDEGAEVEFQIKQGPKGPQAMRTWCGSPDRTPMTVFPRPSKPTRVCATSP